MTALGLLPRRMRSVRACSRRAGSMFQERGLLSTKTGVAADVLLEGLEVGAGGGDPVGAEGLVDEVELAAAHVRGREVEAGLVAHGEVLLRGRSVSRMRRMSVQRLQWSRYARFSATFFGQSTASLYFWGSAGAASSASSSRK